MKANDIVYLYVADDLAHLCDLWRLTLAFIERKIPSSVPVHQTSESPLCILESRID